MSFWMNQTELRDAVKRHCGAKMEKNEQICRPCAKKLSRAKKIDWQIKYLWKMKERGLIHKLEEASENRSNKRDDKQTDQRVEKNDQVQTRAEG